MDCNKDEAIRAKGMAERKMEKNDFEGARRIALKAQNLYPELENIAQMLSICDVHCSAQIRLLGSEKDWYGILQVEKLADEQTIKKQYRRLALILHPDKNRFPGAEGAFKLICEANALLSDPSKKSLYDNKIRVLSRSAPINPPNHYINRSSQPNKQYSAQDKGSNGFSGLNQHQAGQFVSSSRKDVFWTCCPYCRVRYQYLRQYINKSLHCPQCTKVFTTYEISDQGVPSGSKLGQQGPQHMPSQPVPRQPAGFQEKVVPNPANFKMGVHNTKGPSAPNTQSHQTASQKTVPPEPSVRTGCGSKGVKIAGAAGNLKTEKPDKCNARSLHGGKPGVASSNDTKQGVASANDTKQGVASANDTKPGVASGNDTIIKERRDVKSKSWKGGKRQIVESSDSSDVEIEDPIMQENDANFMRRSSRKRQHISYEETDEEDHASSFKRAQATKEDKGKEKNDAVDSKNSKNGSRSNFPTDAGYCDSGDNKMRTARSNESWMDKDAHCDKEGKTTGGKSGAAVDTVEIESGSDGDISSSTKSDTGLLQCPDPEFSDFDKVRLESHFKANQFWACYDTLDSMPRFYAKVKKVCSSPFELHITWLEAQPIDDTFEEWVDEELPVGCGGFKVGTTEKTSLRLSFSHQVHCQKGKKRGYLAIYPREGEVWALFKDWDKNWSSNPHNLKDFKYEIVQVLADFVPHIGIKVCYMDKIAGFVSLFQRANQSEMSSFVIGPDELYKFSHSVPYFKMTGSEREGVPVGSFELDPACLPLNPDDLYYPCKAENKHRS